MDHRLRQLRDIEPRAADRRGHQQVEVLGEEEGRKRGNDVGEQQNREKGQKDDA
jgi:hypothetical protein